VIVSTNASAYNEAILLRISGFLRKKVKAGVEYALRFDEALQAISPISSKN
jgi:hypothetical protein